MGKPNEGDKGEINIQNKNKTPIQMSLSQVQAMAEQNRSSAAATGVVGGLASEVNPHLVDECQMSLTNMYQDLIDKEEELGGAKNLLSLSKKSSSLKKTTKQPKPHAPTPRGKGKI